MLGKRLTQAKWCRPPVIHHYAFAASTSRLTAPIPLLRGSQRGFPRRAHYIRYSGELVG